MTLLRSLAYQLLFLPWTLGVCLIYLPLLLGPRKLMQAGARLWLSGALFLQHRVLGLTYQIKGIENLPAGACLIAAKHQSAWDTMIFHRILADPAYVLKKELLSLPFIGWYLQKTGQVAIDRKAGMKALKLMVDAAKVAADEGRQVIIFPEGHRQPPGVTGDYHSGVAALYSGLELPLVPVALNSGLFWGRNSFLRHAGCVTLEFLPAIAPGMNRKLLMPEIESRIETATRALEAEATLRFPQLPKVPVDKV